MAFIKLSKEKGLEFDFTADEVLGLVVVIIFGGTLLCTVIGLLLKATH